MKRDQEERKEENGKRRQEGRRRRERKAATGKKGSQRVQEGRGKDKEENRKGDTG